MREIITIHVGQAGIQLGNTCWEFFCLEHNIQPDGYKTSKELISGDEDAFRTFFSETSDPNKYTARSIFMDLEPDAIDHLRSGTYSELFPVEQMISAKEGASHNFARGYCTVGRQYVELCLDRIRKVAVQCQDLQGFIVFNSLGGGTGSGLGSLLLENLSAEYEKKTKVSVPIYPSAQGSTSVVEPYNTALATKYQMDHTDVTTLMENEALYGINRKHLQIEKPSYINLNNVVAQMVSSMTASMRLDGCLNENLDELEKNLIPYPAVHFTFSSFTPFVPEDVLKMQTSELELTLSLFSADYMSIKCDPNQAKYMAVNMLYRGEYIPKNIGAAFSTFKTRRLVSFVDRCPTGCKVGIDYHPPVVIPESKIRPEKKNVCMLANSSAISQVFSRNEEEFDKMYKNRAFLHWYLSEGMEEGNFVEARENLASLQLDYREIEREEEDEEAGEDV